MQMFAYKCFIYKDLDNLFIIKSLLLWLYCNLFHFSELKGLLMKRKYCLGLSLFALLVVLMSSIGARADVLYTFTGDNFNGSPSNTFSFTEASFFTTTEAFQTSFVIDGTTFTHGFFDASSDCFAFSASSIANCNGMPNVVNFTGSFAGATQVGTFAVGNFVSCSIGGNSTVCEGLQSLTISQDAATTPEPSSLILLATGALGAAGILRRRFIRG
jgi:hypothetical protein